MHSIMGPGRRGAVALLAAAALFAAGCGQSGGGAAQQNSTAGRPAPSTPTEQSQPQFGRAFTANPAITGARPLPFTSWSRVADDRIAINFQTGSPECYGVDVSTTETDHAVTVALRAGALPEAVGRMCTMVEVFGTLEIPLRHSLGNRTVLSAA